MSDSSATSSYEPMLAWHCNHNLIDVGSPYTIWTSNNTPDATAPVGAPAVQKKQCTICNGVGWFNVRVDKHNEIIKF